MEERGIKSMLGVGMFQFQINSLPLWKMVFPSRFVSHANYQGKNIPCRQREQQAKKLRHRRMFEDQWRGQNDQRVRGERVVSKLSKFPFWLFTKKFWGMVFNLFCRFILIYVIDLRDTIEII